MNWIPLFPGEAGFISVRMTQSLLETCPKCPENSPRLFLRGEPPPIFVQWCPSLVAGGQRCHHKTALLQLPFMLEAGAYSVPAAYQREALALPKLLLSQTSWPAQKIKNPKPRSSASSGISYVPILSTPPSFHHPIPAVYKLMNSLPATHLKKILSCLLKGDK